MHFHCIKMHLFLIILSLFLIFTGVTAYQTFLRQVFGSALMGDLLSTLPSRFHCVGAGKNFTHFMLFSRVHPDQHRPLVPNDRELLYKSDFDSSLPTKIIIHGFVDNLHISDWMQRMKTRFLLLGDFNVIIVDWSCGNEFPYFQAVQNSKIVADELRSLVSFLKDSADADPSSFHLIGHSLGSHIAALVGHRIPHLGRISALDPAGPKFYDVPLEERLDPGDALFVDAIHTDAGHGLMEGLGMRSQVGHLDFYPNGGKDQPGCHSSPFTILPRIGFHRAARYYVTCDHYQSIEYYIDSIRTPVRARLGGSEPECQHIGVACRDWETYSQGRCADCSHTGNCAAMGYFSDIAANLDVNSNGHEYYVKTAEEEPYCMFQYQMIVETGCDQGSCSEPSTYSSGFNPGVIRLELTTRSGRLARLNLDDKAGREMRAGAQYAYLATSRFPIDEVRGAKVWWGHSSKPELAVGDLPMPRTSGLKLKKIEVFPIDLPDKLQRYSIPEVTVLCGSREKTIAMNQYLDLKINDC